MRTFAIILSLLGICVLYNSNALALSLPGPMVYVVTPSPRPPQINEGRSAPFYYHNWMRRMDSGPNATTTTAPTTTTIRVKTPDLIFAEFESDGSMKKSIRKLLEKERVEGKTSTPFQPIYVPEDEFQPVTQKTNYVLPTPNEKQNDDGLKQSDYFEMYNNLYNHPAPVYNPKPTLSSSTTTASTTVTTTSPTQDTLSNVQNIWHIIDSEKSNQNTGSWEEIPVKTNDEKVIESSIEPKDHSVVANSEDENDDNTYDNFALPGFTTKQGNGAENESRAIRTETNLRFPYVNLKPFQMKSMKKPIQNLVPNSKKGNNLFTNLDNFYDLKNPVRGEAQDVVLMRQPIDRYNPAQPYLPQPSYGVNSKQSNAAPAPAKATANLVPPPPPPAPKVTDNDFPAPTNYESFPPYPPSIPDSAPPPSIAPKPAVSSYSPPSAPADDSDSDSFSSNDSPSGPPMDLGYRYKPPSAPVQPFAPTLPPPDKPFSGYSYNKPPMSPEPSPMASMDDMPDFQGYHYDKPAAPPPSKPIPPPSYGHHDLPPSYQPDNDYPELVFQKHHGDDSKDSNDMKGGDDMDMMAPPPPPDMKPDMHGPPDDDSGFPSDFHGDFKYHHDFDDHDFYHHHHPTTTTSTTEMPRVNRYSYYYLGKKLYYLPLYFSVYFIVYVGALIIKAVLRHKIVYPNSWRPNDTTAGFFTKRSIESWDLSNENLHEITGKVTHAISTAAKMYMDSKKKK